MARVDVGQHPQRVDLVNAMRLRCRQRRLRFGQRGLRLSQLQQRLGLAAQGVAQQVRGLQRLGALLQQLAVGERVGVLVALELHFAQIAQRNRVIARGGLWRHQHHRLLQQFTGCVEALQLAQGPGGLQQGHPHGARPGVGPCQVQPALHPFERRVVVVEVVEFDPEVGGGYDGPPDLAGGQGLRVAGTVVPDGLDVLATLRCQGGKEAMRPGGRCRMRVDDASGQLRGPFLPGGGDVVVRVTGGERRVGHGDPHRVCALGSCGHSPQLGIRTRGVALPHRNGELQPVRVGTADGITARIEIKQGLRAQGGACVQLASQELRLAANQHQPCLAAARRGFVGQAGLRFIRQCQRPLGIALAHLPGQGNHRGQALGALRRNQGCFQHRDRIVGGEEFQDGEVGSRHGEPWYQDAASLRRKCQTAPGGAIWSRDHSSNQAVALVKYACIAPKSGANAMYSRSGADPNRVKDAMLHTVPPSTAHLPDTWVPAQFDCNIWHVS